MNLGDPTILNFYRGKLIKKVKFKDWEELFLKVVTSMRGNMSMINAMAGVDSFGRMVPTILVSGEMECEAVKVNL